jgi:hypothetical protein
LLKTATTFASLEPVARSAIGFITRDMFRSTLMSKRGRPPILDDAKRRNICALAAAGCGLQDAARYIGCSVSTIRRSMARDREFREQLRASELNAQVEPLRAMRKAASTHWRAAAWMLERTNHRRFARPHVKAYAAEEVSTVINDVIMAATTDIKDIELRVRIICRLRLAAEDAARALQAAEDRRLRPKRAKEAQKNAEELNRLIENVKILQDGLDRLEACRQNSKNEEASSSANTSVIPAPAEAQTTEPVGILHSEMGPP